MGLFGSSDPAKQQEKLLAKEEKQEEKALKQAVKDVKKAEKAEVKAAKAEHHSHAVHDKAAKAEAKIEAALHKAEHKRDQAISKEQHTATDINTKHNEHERLSSELERKKIALDNLTQQKHQHQGIRETKLAELHEPTAATAGTGIPGTATGEGALAGHHTTATGAGYPAATTAETGFVGNEAGAGYPATTGTGVGGAAQRY